MVPQSEGTFLFFQSEARSLSSLAVVGTQEVQFMAGGEPQQLRAASVTHEFFEVLQTRPLIGRIFLKGEDRPGGEAIVALSESLWRSAFGADPEVLNRVVEFDGVGRRIVGVLPDDLAFWESDVMLYQPEVINESDPSMGNFNYLGVGRMAPGATVESTRTELGQLLPRLWATDPQ